MLLSLRHRFIFIHIYKTAGTSLTHALRPYAREPLPARILERVGLRKPAIAPLPDHVSARDLRESIPRELFESCFKFAFVRNPWDWQVSLYHYMRELRRHPQHRIVQSLSFDEYIDWRVSSDKHLQREFVADESGKLLVDFVGRFESLDRDAQTVFERIGIRATVPHRNRSFHGGYRTYYSERSKRLVSEHFAEDIEMFGYSF
ncbi:MAG TPA: sulfotransferase family 2 domain-containing protein [Thermoanaerobaculia bacterium]